MTPIAIMSFNRPQYLVQVLQSLKNQSDFPIDEANLFFFQDGAVNAFSGKRYAEDATIAECVDLFRTHFPGGNVLKADANLGVALNFERAESLMFEQLKTDIAFFLEDDLVLGPYYMKVLAQLSALVEASPEVGYFAAYGNQYAGIEEQFSAAHRLLPMAHNWAFGLTRIQWLRSRPFVEQYLALVRGIDYRDRDNKKIARLMNSWGGKCPGSSQDVAKSLACLFSGGVKLKTYTSYGRYIGEIGLHSNPQSFDKMGFRNAVYVDKDICKVTTIPEKEIVFARSRLELYSQEEAIKPD